MLTLFSRFASSFLILAHIVFSLSLHHHRPVSVVGQCKAEKKKTGSKHIRDFESALYAESPGVIGVFASESGYSSVAQDLVRASVLPMLAVHLEDVSASIGHVSTMERPKALQLRALMINRAAQLRIPDVSVAQHRAPLSDRSTPLIADRGRPIHLP